MYVTIVLYRASFLNKIEKEIAKFSYLQTANIAKIYRIFLQ